LTATDEDPFESEDESANPELTLVELQNKINVINQHVEILLRNVSHASAIRPDFGAYLTNPAARAIDLYDDRRRRAKLFGPNLFGEPAWDILLDLFIASETGKKISVTSACIGAAVPLTTALRWLSMLEARGLILRENDEKDARRSNVRLSDLGRELMEQYLSES
jgi:predicted transcriptional regulator